MRPPAFSYPGAKARMVADLVSMMPDEGNLYVEPFAGRGSVLLGLLSLDPTRFRRYWLNDLQTAFFLTSILTHGDKIRIPSTPESIRREYYRWLKRRQAERPDTARQALLEPHVAGHGGIYGRTGPASTGNATSAYFRGVMRRAHALLTDANPRITAKDWKALRLDRLSSEDFVFLDPPYYQADVRAYAPWPLEEYLRMVDMLSEAKCKWMLTEYRQPFYVEAFGEPVYVKKTTCLVNNGKDDQRGIRTECVWTNYRKV